MNIEKTKQKLKNLSEKDIKILKQLINEEESGRITYASNIDTHPDEIARDLGNFFANAWIH